MLRKYLTTSIVFIIIICVLIGTNIYSFIHSSALSKKQDDLAFENLILKRVVNSETDFFETFYITNPVNEYELILEEYEGEKLVSTIPFGVRSLPSNDKSEIQDYINIFENIEDEKIVFGIVYADIKGVENFAPSFDIDSRHFLRTFTTERKTINNEIKDEVWLVSFCMVEDSQMPISVDYENTSLSDFERTYLFKLVVN